VVSGRRKLCTPSRQRAPDLVTICEDIATDQGSTLPDILIRGVPDHIVANLETNANRAGLSRTEYIRRLLEREHRSVQYAVTVDSLRRFRAIFSDLEDPGVISSAWS